MGMLWKYSMIGNLSNENAGYSMWGFAKKDGKVFFIKQFLSPKYPANDYQSSPDRIQKKINVCNNFIQEKRRIYDVVNKVSDGNDVRIQELFRVDSKFYIVMEKINALPWTIQDVCALNETEKRRLCAIIAHGVAALHSGGLVHADIKHENVLFTKTEIGTLTAKIIDFDSAFLEDAPPPEEEDIVGDWVYFSPEVWLRANGEKVTLSCKMDVFALGILFHQYFSGELPSFDRDGCGTVGQAVVLGKKLQMSEKVPEDLLPLIREMLSLSPEERPSAQDVFLRIRSTFVKENPGYQAEPSDTGNTDEEEPSRMKESSDAVSYENTGTNTQGNFFYIPKNF